MSRTSKKKGLGKNSDGDLNTIDSFFYKFCLEDDKKLVKATEDVQGAPVMDSSHLKVWRKDAGVTTKEGDEVLIAGEMNPVPKVQPEEVVTESFGEIPSKGVVSDEAVAMGEAIQGGTLLDATLISLGSEYLPLYRNSDIGLRTSIPLTSGVLMLKNNSVVLPERHFAQENYKKISCMRGESLKTGL